MQKSRGRRRTTLETAQDTTSTSSSHIAKFLVLILEA